MEFFKKSLDPIVALAIIAVFDIFLFQIVGAWTVGGGETMIAGLFVKALVGTKEMNRIPFWRMVFKPTWAYWKIYISLGMGFGALVSAILSKEFYWRVPKHLSEWVMITIGGLLMGLWSRPEIVSAAALIGLRAGASLAEDSAGTNAVALALAAQGPVILKGEEHLCRIFHDWTCVAAPVISADGTLIGCLDISAPEGPIHEKLALARSIAREIGRLVGNKISFGGITIRQREVLALFAHGMSYKGIGSVLGISIKTVEEHLDAVRIKMGMKNRRACIKKAIELGIL